MERITEVFSRVFNDGELVRMIFGNKRKKSLEYKRVTIRPVLLDSGLCYQAEYTYDKKVTQTNLRAGEVCSFAERLVAEDFKQINIFTLSEDIEILAAKPEKPKITTKPATKGMPCLEHNREKKRIIPDGVPCDFLIRLGVMEENGKVVQRYYSKYRQINRYLEIVEECAESLPKDRPLKIVDFGCGKAYLTFALYYYFTKLHNRPVDIIGLDLKDDVIRFCSRVASDLHYDGLKFLKGDISKYTGDSAEMVVTLHACDTATDYALINAVSWNTKVILSVPCCQHELFSQIKNDLHQPMLKYGILKDRLTEYLTDGLRGLKLEAKGYDVAMVEFTSLEHTARNIMIKAVKPAKADPARAEKAQQEYEALCEFYHVHPTIDKLK